MANKVLEPFDFEKSPSMSSQLFGAAPSVFGGKDGVSPLQTVNRVMVGGPLDIFDLVGRSMDTGMRGVAELVGEGYEALGGGQGMSERAKREVYGLAQMAGLMAGSSPSALSGARFPSNRAAAASESTPSSGIMLAIEGPQKPSGLLSAPKTRKALEGEIVSGPSDDYLKAQANRDKSISKEGRAIYEDEMDEEALRDSLETIRRDIDDAFEDAAERGFEPMDSDGFFGDFIDAVMGAKMKAEDMGQKPNMGEIIAEELPRQARSFENSYGLFVDYNQLTDKLAKTADDVYGFGVKKAKNRREQAAANARSLQMRKYEAERATSQRESDRMLGITDDMTEAQKQDIRVKYAIDQQNMASGMGLPEPQQQGPNLRIVVDNEDLD
jgi:hypothetical protein